MGTSEAEYRAKELTGLITNQLRLIRKLEKRGKDPTSAKIVFDSLRVSLFLATQEWHRVRGIESAQTWNDANRVSSGWESRPSLVVVPQVKHRMAQWTDRETSMKTEDDFLERADKIGSKEIEQRLDTSIVPGAKVEEINDSSEGSFEFRPLTEEEKKQFVNSLNADGKRILAQLADKATYSDESAA